ncbi:hypothetical protein MHU86_7098 [Fragilaria crotonensis]|nr:hypothetical protein MHU86_7098 [Fragilaria crotonensis]
MNGGHRPDDQGGWEGRRVHRRPHQCSGNLRHLATPDRDIILDNASAASRRVIFDSRQESSNESYDRTWRRWRGYCNHVGYPTDTCLTLLSDNERELFLRAFLNFYRTSNWNSDGRPTGTRREPVVASTLRQATSNLASAFRNNIGISPLHLPGTSNIRPIFRSWFQACENGDPPKRKQRAITPQPPVDVQGSRRGIDKSTMPNGVSHCRNRDRCVLLRNAVMRDNIDYVTRANQDHTSPRSCLQGRDPPRDTACFLTGGGRQPSDSDLRESEEWSKDGPSNSGTDGRPRHVPSHATSIPDQKDTQGGPQAGPDTPVSTVWEGGTTRLVTSDELRRQLRSSCTRGGQDVRLRG